MSQIKTYLSIDLDFWQNEKLPVEFLFGLLDSVRNKFFCVNHHAILSHLTNNIKFDTLINIDWHSDIADDYGKETPELNCGTWVNSITNARSKEFYWIYPHRKCATKYEGYCHVYNNPFVKQCSVWRKEKVRKKHLFKPELLEKFLEEYNIVGICICLSPDYGGKKHQTWFEDAAKRYQCTIDSRSHDDVTKEFYEKSLVGQ